MRRVLKALFLALVAIQGALSDNSWSQFQDRKKYGENFEEEKARVEVEPALPEYPKPENLVQFYVGVTASNTFLVDEKTLSVNEDGVVRYVLVIKAPGGASNVSFEGMNCKTKERRLYALGSGDAAWVMARARDWTGIRPGSHQAILYKEYFCPNGVSIYKSEEGVDALRRGGNLRAK